MKPALTPQMEYPEMNEDERAIAADLFQAIKTAINKSQAILDYKNFMDAVVSRVGLEMSRATQ